MKRKALGDVMNTANLEDRPAKRHQSWHAYRPVKLDTYRIKHKNLKWDVQLPDGYKAAKYLAKGSYGVASSTSCSASDVPLVVKAIQCGDACNTESALRELHALMFFTMHAPHPHIIKLLDCYYTKDTLYLVLERYDLSLHDAVQDAEDNPITEAKRRRITFMMLDAFRHIHGFGLVHRDLKPGNIVVSKDLQRLAVIDLGGMRKPSDAARCGPPLTPAKNCMTDGYAAPEACSADDGTHYAREADNFNAGLVLCELITGNELFATNADVLSAVSKLRLEKKRRAFVESALKGTDVAEHEINLITSLLAASPVVRAKSHQALKDVCKGIIAEEEERSQSKSGGSPDANGSEGEDDTQPSTPLLRRASSLAEDNSGLEENPYGSLPQVEYTEIPYRTGNVSSMQALVKEKVAAFRAWSGRALKS